MSNKIERSFALAIFFRFSDRWMHLLFPIFPTYGYKSSLEIRHNFMRAVSKLKGCKFPLWHTSNYHEQKVHYLSSNLSIYDFSMQSKAVEVQPFEVWVRNEKMAFFQSCQNAKSTFHLENVTVIIVHTCQKQYVKADTLKFWKIDVFEYHYRTQYCENLASW